MSSEILERRFGRIGARIHIAEEPWLGLPQIGIGFDRRGEFFDVRFAERTGHAAHRVPRLKRVPIPRLASVCSGIV
jgi:hypothetical protein